MATEIHKTPPLHIPDHTSVRGKVLYAHVYDTFEHFCETNEHKEIGWLLLIRFIKAGEEEDRLRDRKSQIKCCINDMKVDKSALKKTHYLM